MFNRAVLNGFIYAILIAIYVSLAVACLKLVMFQNYLSNAPLVNSVIIVAAPIVGLVFLVWLLRKVRTFKF